MLYQDGIVLDQDGIVLDQDGIVLDQDGMCGDWLAKNCCLKHSISASIMH